MVTVQQLTEITFAAETDVGRSRQGQPNQDSLGSYEDYCRDQERLVVKGKLFVVADGMGGAAGGREASRIAVEVVFHSYYADPDTDIVASLRGAFQAANAKIHRHGLTHPELRGLGTTIVVAVIRGRSLVVGNVGDSRAYLLHQHRLRQISLDHTAVQEQVREGLLTPEEGATHPRRHVLSRNLGFRPKAQPDFETQDLFKGDTILLCSDGLWGSVEDDEIAAVLQQADCETAVDILINLANGRGGPDNISGIVIHVDSVEQPPGAAATDPDHQAAQQRETVEPEPITLGTTVSSISEATATIKRVPADGQAAAASLDRTAATVGAAKTASRRRWLTPALAIIALLLLGAAVYQIRPMLRVPSLGNTSAVSNTQPDSIQRSIDPVPSLEAGILPNQSSAITATLEPTDTVPPAYTPTATALPPTPTAEPTETIANSTSQPSIAASMRMLPARPDAAQAVALSEDGQLLATGSPKGRITLWRAENQAERTSFMVEETSIIQRINSLAFSVDGKRLAAGLENGTVQVWEIPAEIKTNQACRCRIGKPLTFPAASGAGRSAVLSVVFSGNNQLAAASQDGVVMLWDVVSQQATQLRTQQGAVRAMAVSADGTTIAIVDSQGKLHVTDYQGNLARAYSAIENAHQVALSGDGKILAVATIDGAKGAVTLWRDQKEVAIEINGTISSIALSQSGQYLSVTIYEGAVLWFDLIS